MNLIKPIAYFDLGFGVIFVFYCLLVITIFRLMNKMRVISSLKKNVDYLKKTVEELDQQAKLIIKSDMELKLYQQEVEDKINKLAMIKNLVISSMPILDKEKLFSQINKRIINYLGFKRGVILEYNNLEVKVNVDFKIQDIETIKNIFKYKKDALKHIQLLAESSDIYQQLQVCLQTQDLIVGPITREEQIDAIFIVSNLIFPTGVSRSEKEAFLTICMYLSQCIDKINLFENIYRTKDELEKKVKERTNELLKSLREIELINKAKSDFISSVSHELRTPLTSVKGFSSLLVDEKFGKLPEEAKKRLTKIDENVDKLMDMINVLLDISRIEAQKIELKIAPFEITKLIKEVADFLAPQIKSKEINLVLDLPPRINAYIDKNLIERVLLNLINNAIKFTPEGGRITISCKKDDNKALVSVADTGCGIKKADLAKVFQEFFRVDDPSHKEIKGTGLGLSLVKRIIETHKEKVWVESEVDKGSTFYFTLKIVKDE